MENQFNHDPSGERSPKTQDSWVAVAGGAAIAAGSLMPFVTITTPGVIISSSGTRDASVFFGLIVVGLGFALRVAPRPGRLIVGLVILGLCSLAFLGYVGGIWLGAAGMLDQDAYGDSFTLTFTPDIGLYAAIVGSVVAVIAAIRSLVHLSAR